MKSLPWGKMGDVNMRGRKSLRVADDTAQNFTERERIKFELQQAELEHQEHAQSAANPLNNNREWAD